MKLGVSSHLLPFGEDKYERLAEAGFHHLDMNLANTSKEPYTLDEGEFIKYLENERRKANDAGITFHQIHGPWQWPLYDRHGEELELRLKLMKMSARAASLLGAKYLVIHPVMPNGIEENVTRVWLSIHITPILPL